MKKKSSLTQGKFKLHWFKGLGKRTTIQLAVLLITAYAEHADQEARKLLYNFWPEADWDGFVREELGSGPLMIIRPIVPIPPTVPLQDAA